MTATIAHAPEREIPGMDTTAYRTLLTFAVDSCVLPRVQEQLASWLRERQFEVDLTVSGWHATASAELVVVHHESAAGRDFRARTVEVNQAGRWTTELTAHVPPRGTGWLTLNVTNDRGRNANVPRLARYLLDVLDTYDGEMPLSSEAVVVGAAGVEELFDAACDPDRHGLLMVAGTDAGLPFSAFVDKVRFWTSNVRGLAQAVVLDPPATQAFNQLIGTTHAVAPWTMRSYQAAVDPAWEPDARRHRILGSSRLGSQPDTAIRGYLSRIAREHAAQRPTPQAVIRVGRDLARLEDRLLVAPLLSSIPEVTQSPGAVQHPTADLGRPGAVTESTLEPDAATRTPADDPTVLPAQPEPTVDASSSQDRPASPGVADVPARPAAEHQAGVLEPSDGSSRDDDATVAAGDQLTAEAASYLAQVELAKQLLGVESLDEDTLRQVAETVRRARHDAEAVSRITRELTARQQRIADLEDEVAFHKELYAEEEFDRVLAEEARTRAEDEARWLRQQLREEGNFTAAHATVPTDSLTRYPNSFDELLSRLPELAGRGVVFTGDQEVVRGLDDVDGNGKIVRAAWESLLVAADYVAARNAGDHHQGLGQYLERTPSGYRPLSTKKHAWGESSATMAKYGSDRVFPVPRDVAPSGCAFMEAHFKLGRVGMVSPRLHYLDDYANTGKVLVGYIGPHLRTVSTN